MKFSSREDIEVPIAQVWAIATDYDAFERAARRRGAEVQRTDTGTGMPSWSAAFNFKGKRRVLAIRQTRAEAPHLMVFEGEGKLLAGTVQIEMLELGPRRTRMTVTSEVRPLTLAARLFLQSVKLARARVVKRYQSGIAKLATMIEARARGQKSGF